MSFPAYPSYRTAGLDWCGNLPAHWSTRRLKTLFHLMRRPTSDTDKIITAFRDGQVTLRERRREEGFTNALQEIGYQGIKAGDLVIHAMDGFAGAIGVSDADGKSSPVYSVCMPGPEAQAQYFALLLRHMALSGFITALARGVRERSTEFRWSDASVLTLPCPPLYEQQAIVTFLERETAKIDALVEEQRLLVELLREKRQAAISHAVTRGLDASVAMKDSGLDWLGQVPAHWAVTRLRFLCNISTGDADTADAEEGGEYPFFVRSPNVERIGRYTHDCEAVLTAGDGAGVGKVYHHFEGRFRAHQRVYIFSGFRGVRGRFFYSYMSEMFAKTVLEGTAKSTVESLRRPMIADFWMTVPPENEQDDILAHLEVTSGQLDALVDKAQAAIALLLERRAALISAAVTGAIDVREAAASRLDAQAA